MCHKEREREREREREKENFIQLSVTFCLWACGLRQGKEEVHGLNPTQKQTSLLKRQEKC